MGPVGQMKHPYEQSDSLTRLRTTPLRIEKGDMHAGLVELRAELDELAALIQSTDGIRHIAQSHAILRGLIEKEGGP